MRPGGRKEVEGQGEGESESETERESRRGENADTG